MPISVNGVDEAEGLEKILEEDGKGETRTLQNKSKRATDRIRNNILTAYVERDYALYSSPNIIRVIKSRRLRWAGHVARMGESKGA
jgi:hypothetical protein